MLHDNYSCDPSKLSPDRQYIRERDVHHLKPNMDSLIQEIRAKGQSVLGDVNGSSDPKATVLLPATLDRLQGRTEHQG